MNDKVKNLLSQVQTVHDEGKKRFVVYGIEGVGKTTWASRAPNPIFLSTEDGLGKIKVPAFPVAKTWLDIEASVSDLLKEKHDYKTLVLDTIDGADSLLQKNIVEKNKKTSIEDWSYGKGYVIVAEEFRRFLWSLERLRAEKDMHIVVIGHSQVRIFNCPDGPDYDRYEMSCSKRIAAMLKEWSDALFFFRFEVFVKEEGHRNKGARGDRVIETTHAPAWEAKNRLGLPEQMPMNGIEFWQKIK